MKLTYIYLHHQGFDFYLSDEAIEKEDLYCELCEDYDELIAAYDNEKDLGEHLRHLFKEGYDILPCPEYDEIRAKYCPLEMIIER